MFLQNLLVTSVPTNVAARILKKRLPQSQKRRENSKLMWRVSDRRKRLSRGLPMQNGIRAVQEPDAVCLGLAAVKNGHSN
jgi:hypothetical protein